MADAARNTVQSLDFHSDRLQSKVAGFSGGRRQTVAIGRAIYCNANVLIMADPTTALGVSEPKKVLDLINAVKAKGHGTIFISLNLLDIFDVADRSVVLHRGNLAGTRNISETTHDEVVRLMAADRPQVQPFYARLPSK